MIVLHSFGATIFVVNLNKIQLLLVDYKGTLNLKCGSTSWLVITNLEIV